MKISDKDFHEAYFNVEMTELWNLKATIGNESLNLKDSAETLANIVEETLRQLEQASKSLERSRDLVFNVKSENQRLKNAGNALFDYADDGSPLFHTLADDWNEAQGLGRPHGTTK